MKNLFLLTMLRRLGIELGINIYNFFWDIHALCLYFLISVLGNGTHKIISIIKTSTYNKPVPTELKYNRTGIGTDIILILFPSLWEEVNFIHLNHIPCKKSPSTENLPCSIGLFSYLMEKINKNKINRSDLLFL